MMLAACSGAPGAWLSGMNHTMGRDLSEVILQGKLDPSETEIWTIIGHRGWQARGKVTCQMQALALAGRTLQSSHYVMWTRPPSSASDNDSCSLYLRDDYSLKSWLRLITLEIIYSWQPRLLTWTSKYPHTSHMAPLTHCHLLCAEQESALLLHCT